MKSTYITIIVLILILALAAVCTWWFMERNDAKQLQESAAGQALRTETDAVAYTDLEGNIVDVSEYIGQTTIVLSWASWCPSCSTQLQLLAEVKTESETPIQILAINRSEDRTTAERYLRGINVDEKVILILDPTDRFYKSINGYAMPETIVYTAEGAISSHMRGDATKEQLKKAINKAVSPE